MRIPRFSENEDYFYSCLKVSLHCLAESSVVPLQISHTPSHHLLCLVRFLCCAKKIEDITEGEKSRPNKTSEELNSEQPNKHRMTLPELPDIDELLDFVSCHTLT